MMDVVRSCDRTAGPSSAKRLTTAQLAFLSRSLSTVIIPTTDSALEVKKKFTDVVKTCFQYIRVGLSTDTAFEDRLLPILPYMAKCFVAFIRLYILKESSFPVEEVDRMNLSLPFAHLYAHKPQAMEALAEPRAFMDCWARLWALALQSESSDFSMINLYWTTIRKMAFTATGEATLTFATFKGVLDEQSSQLLAHSCILRLASGTNDLKVRLIMLSTITICSRVSLDLQRLFLASNGIKWALNPPHRLIKTPGLLPTPQGIENDSLENIETDFRVTIHFIRQSVSIGRLWVAEAVRHGLLERIFDSQAFLYYSKHTHATVAEDVPLASAVLELITMINSHTVHRAVLKEAHSSVEKLLRMKVEQKLDRKGILWAAWEALKTTVKQRWLARKRHNPFDTSTSAIPNAKHDYNGAAAVIQLTIVDEPAKSKTGSLITSRSVRHAKRNVEGHAHPFTDYDWQFLKTIVDDDVKLCFPEIPNLVIDLLDRPRSALHSPLVLRIDYVPVPRKVEITGVEHLQDWKGWEQYEDWKEHSELEGRLYVRIPDGMSSFITVNAKVR
ncbi:hypothetical protein BDZ89DRAFT_1137702 [Hymenopellis radicata]|nr:hypothetical protein BDZ89DRAFT_1137702 [Hymenopellis radicata]